jgi:CelD/BcsL family acetyltransferase involved in cellulose biosynthesis
MANWRCVVFRSSAELRAVASAWDDLWQRSAVTRPTLRAELVAQWVDDFAADQVFRAVVVERDGQFVAALPLVTARLGRFVRAGGLTTNDWSPCGDLLLDEGPGAAEALDVLLGGMRTLPWSLFCFDAMIDPSPRWQEFRRALDRARMPHAESERFRVGVIDVGGDWEDRKKSWSKNHRRNVAKSLKRLEATGGYTVRVATGDNLDAVAPLLRVAMEVEDRSWKGRAGTSILRTAGMPEHFERQALQTAAWGQLYLAVLEQKGRGIASEYGWLAKGVYHPMKVGYDEAMAGLGPGQLLMYLILEQLHARHDCHAVDCLGPLAEMIKRWEPRVYSVCRLLFATRRPLGRALLYGYKHVWPHVSRWRGKEAIEGTRLASAKEPATAVD